MARTRASRIIIPITLAAIAIAAFLFRAQVAAAWHWVAAVVGKGPTSAGETIDGNGFLVIGHRGAAADAVENTIPSMEEALRQGANALEVDLSMTSDGQIVIWHDWDPDDPIALAREKGLEPDVLCHPRFPDQGSRFRRPLNTLTLAEFRAHFGYALKEGDSAVRAEIPTLAELLAWTSRRPELRCVFLDVKVPESQGHLIAPFIRTVDSLIALARPMHRIVFLVPSLALLDSMGRHHAGGNISYDAEPSTGVVLHPCDQGSTPAAIARGNRFASLIAPGSKTVAPFTTLRRILACDLERRAAHNRSGGTPVEGIFVSTLNDPEEITSLVRLGVDGIISDSPARLRRTALAAGATVR